VAATALAHWSGSLDGERQVQEEPTASAHEWDDGKGRNFYNFLVVYDADCARTLLPKTQQLLSYHIYNCNWSVSSSGP
jgi:hypothetical protein